MLPDNELNAIRDELERLTMPGTAYILSGTLASDGMGGFTTTWGTASTVKCPAGEPAGANVGGG